MQLSHATTVPPPAPEPSPRCRCSPQDPAHRGLKHWDLAAVWDGMGWRWPGGSLHPAAQPFTARCPSGSPTCSPLVLREAGGSWPRAQDESQERGGWAAPPYGEPPGPEPPSTAPPMPGPGQARGPEWDEAAAARPRCLQSMPVGRDRAQGHNPITPAGTGAGPGTLWHGTPSCPGGHRAWGWHRGHGDSAGDSGDLQGDGEGTVLGRSQACTGQLGAAGIVCVGVPSPFPTPKVPQWGVRGDRDPAVGRGQARSGGGGQRLPEVERNGGCEWRKMERRGLRVKSIDTCGSEHQGLEDVGEGDDAPRVPVLVHQNQAMDLQARPERHGVGVCVGRGGQKAGRGLAGSRDAARALTCSLAMRSMMSSMVSWG